MKVLLRHRRFEIVVNVHSRVHLCTESGDFISTFEEVLLYLPGRNRSIQLKISRVLAHYSKLET